MSNTPSSAPCAAACRAMRMNGVDGIPAVASPARLFVDGGDRGGLAEGDCQR
jgi:hypothetical protein